MPVRLTNNAVTTFHRRLRPTTSQSHAYRELRRACRDARYADEPPRWLRCARGHNDGYLVLEDELAALPIRHGRAVACLVNPDAPSAR